MPISAKKTMSMVCSISVFRKVICGLDSLRKILSFSPAERDISFSFTQVFKTPQQWQGIPRVGVSFTALGFINLVWNLIWFQDSSKKVYRVLFTSQNVTSDGGHQGTCMAESLRGSCQGTAMSSWPQPGLSLTVPISFCLFLSGHVEFQSENKGEMHTTVLLQLYLLLTIFLPQRF